MPGAAGRSFEVLLPGSGVKIERIRVKRERREGAKRGPTADAYGGRGRSWEWGWGRGHAEAREEPLAALDSEAGEEETDL